MAGVLQARLYFLKRILILYVNSKKKEILILYVYLYNSRLRRIKKKKLRKQRRGELNDPILDMDLNSDVAIRPITFKP